MIMIMTMTTKTKTTLPNCAMCTTPTTTKIRRSNVALSSSSIQATRMDATATIIMANNANATATTATFNAKKYCHSKPPGRRRQDVVGYDDNHLHHNRHHSTHLHPRHHHRLYKSGNAKIINNNPVMFNNNNNNNFQFFFTPTTTPTTIVTKLLSFIFLLLLSLSFLSITVIPHCNAFSDTFYFEVKENSPAQTFVGKITTKPGFTYRFNDEPAEFALDPTSGVILTTDVGTDRELKGAYNLVILSSSPTYPLEVKINIIDVNDNMPYWPLNIDTNISFSESAPVGTRVIIDNAIDLDSGPLRYTLDYVNDDPALDVMSSSASSASSSSSVTNTVEQTSSSPFKLLYNSSTTILHLEVASKLDRELQSNYLLNITASDEDGQSSFTIFVVRIIDSNDNPPIFDHSDYSVNLNESMPKDVSVLQVRATDADEEDNDNSRISYYLTSDVTDFRIDSVTGVIYTAHDGAIRCGTSSSSSSSSSSIEKSSSSSSFSSSTFSTDDDQSSSSSWRVCVFTVFAHDYGVPRQDGRTYVTAKIYDSNNHAPIIKFLYFSKSSYANVDENATNGTVVAAVSVTDYDQGQNGRTTVVLIGGNELGHFRLDSPSTNSHIIRVTGALDREKVSQYNLTVQAHDYGSPQRSSMANLLIIVQDHNDHAPMFDREVYETAISETQYQIGKFVYALHATDADEGINSQVYYSISGSNSHYFKIDSNTGLITTDKVINREEIDFFELRITARDGGSAPKWAHALLRVHILDVNDEVPRITLSPSQPSSNYWYNNQTNEYVVKVSDGTHLELDLTTIDGDLGTNGTVDIEILYDYNKLFQMDHDSMKLFSTQTLDSNIATEQQQSNNNNCDQYRLLLQAKDRAPPGAQLSSITTIVVRVIPSSSSSTSNNRLPVVYPKKYFTYVTLGGSQSVNQSVISLSPTVITKLHVHYTSDEDIDNNDGGGGGSKVNFVLRTTDDRIRQLFHVTEKNEVAYSKNVRLLESILASSSSQSSSSQIYKLEFDCIGCQNGESRAEVNFIILDPTTTTSSPQSPFKHRYQFQVEENVPIGTIVGRLLDNDDHDDHHLHLSQYKIHLISGDPYDRFALINGQLQVNAPLDRERQSSYHLQVVAVGSTTSTPPTPTFHHIKVHINVLNINDCVPHFSTPFDRVIIGVDAAPMLIVYRLNAIDADTDSAAGDALTNNSLVWYELNENPYNLFVIEQNNLKLARSIVSVMRHRTTTTTANNINSINKHQPINELLRVRITAHDRNLSHSGDSGSGRGTTTTMRQQSQQQHSASCMQKHCGVSSELLLFISINRVASTTTSTGPTTNYMPIVPQMARFVKRFYEFFITESTPINEQVFKLAARHTIYPKYPAGNEMAAMAAASADDLITYAIVAGNQNNSFGILPSGIVYIANRLDRENIDLYLLQVALLDTTIATANAASVMNTVNVRLNGSSIIGGGNSVGSSSADASSTSSHTAKPTATTVVGLLDTVQVLIHITDVNDNAPKFVQPTYRFVVPENVPTNFYIGQVHATDLDIELNSVIQYSVIPSYYSSFIAIDTHGGYMWTTEQYDRERLSHFEVTIQATDQPIDDVDKRSTQVTVRIDILDVNDNWPVFEVPTNVSTSSTLVGVMGVVEEEEDTFVGMAHRTTTPATTSTNTDISGQLAVSEATPIGSILAHFHANDADFDATIVYALVDHDSSQKFALNSQTGVLSLNDTIDRETKDTYHLTIEASDGAFRSRFHLKIIVEDVDDCPPQWINLTQTQFAIPENISIGSEILTFEAIDADLGANALFYFEIENYHSNQGAIALSQQSSPQPKAFDIHNNRLVVVNHLDYEKARQHKLNISLRESTTKRVASTQIITINLLNINDCAPVFIQRTDTEVVRVMENIDIGTKLLTLQAMDCDQNDSLTYEIVSCNTHYHTHRNIFQKEHELQHKHDTNNCPLKLNTKNGEIININNLDREVIESINLQLSVRDTGGHVDKMKVIFIIEDVNDESPMFVTLRKILITEDVAYKSSPTANTVLGVVKAIDLDMGLNSAITYQLESGSVLDSYVKIDHFTGKFSLKRSLAPLLTSTSTSTSSPHQLPLLMVNVTAIDGGGLSATDCIQFTIKPNLPSLDSIQLSIDLYENEPIGTEVTRLKCPISSPTTDYHQQYSTISTSTSTINNCQFHLINATDRNFQVDTYTGVVSTVDLIDREMLEHRLLEILVITPTVLQTVMVQLNIQDENDNPPYLTNTSIVVHVRESTPPGVELFNLSALVADEDYNNKFDYQIINCSQCDTNNNIFSLNRKQGILTLQSPLDSEKINKYRILFAVSDGIYLLTSMMEIVVDDENDNEPYFDQSTYIFSVEENTNRGTVVGQVIAHDADISNQPLTYSVQTTDLIDPLQSAFSLDPRSGQFTLSKRLDYEQDPHEYVFFIEANDGKYRSSPLVKVIFQLVNLPDNAPVFESTTYRLEVAENQIATDLLCLKATDADLLAEQQQEDLVSNKVVHSLETIKLQEPQSQRQKQQSQQFYLSYYIRSISPPMSSSLSLSQFALNTTTGCLSIVQPLDRETVAIHELTIIATDGHFNATALVTVRVLDENDNTPVFESTTPSVMHIEENAPIDTVVHTFRAVDLDEPPNSYVKYELLIAGDNYTATPTTTTTTTTTLPLVIGPIDGALKVTGPIDRELVDHFDLIIRANDYGFKHYDFHFRLEVDDLIDNSPNFPVPFVELNIYENVTIGEVIFHLSAHDADETDEINYRIIAGDNRGHFRIDDDSLMVCGRVNYEEIKVYQLKINAIDKAGNMDTLNLRINILDVLNERPVFVESPYTVTWYENQLGIVDQFLASPEDSSESGEFGSGLLSTASTTATTSSSSSGTTTTTATAQPSFAIGRINYLLLNNYENSFRLNSTTGVLSVAKMIDRETLLYTHPNGTIELRLIAIDTHSRLSSEGSLFVRILDENDNVPQFDNNMYVFRLWENQQYDANETIGMVNAFDADTDNRLHYRLMMSSSDDGNDSDDLDDEDDEEEEEEKLEYTTQTRRLPFGIDSNGRLYHKFANKFDHEQLDQYHLTVLVNDSRHIVTTSIRVLINDVNDCAPRITKINRMILATSSSLEQKTGQQSQKLQRQQLKVKLSPTELATMVEAKFPLIGVQVIDCDSGTNGRVQFQLNSEQLFSMLHIDQRDGTVKVVDHKSSAALLQDVLSRSPTLDLTVLDSNDLAPLSTTYTITLGLSSSPSPSSTIDTYRKRNLIKERSIELSISELTQVNETLYRFELLQTLNEIIIYAGDPYGHFSIRDNALLLVRRLDYEQTQSYDLYLHATSVQKDYEEFQLIHVRVNVQNENDNPPVFLAEQYFASVPEEDNEELFVVQVQAKDADSDSTKIRYKLINASTNVPFRIEADSGIIWTRSRIDRETVASFRLLVCAVDEEGLNSTTKVVVNIEDRNDNPPRFTRLFRVNITENIPIGSAVIVMTSLDKDVGKNANVTYSLATQTKHFRIDPYSGLVTVAAALDREQQEEYLLTVSADDGSWKAQTTLTIYVLDENDVTPQFEQLSYKFVVPFPSSSTTTTDDHDQSSSLSTIGRVIAHDQDQGLNGVITYRLQSRSKYFTIDTHSGVISCKRLPKLYTGGVLEFLNQHHLVVIASDQGVLPRTESVSVLIQYDEWPSSQESPTTQISNPTQLMASAHIHRHHLTLIVPENLSNGSILYTSDSMITLSTTTPTTTTTTTNSPMVVRTMYNQLLFMGDSLVQIGRSYVVMIDKQYTQMVVNITVIESNMYAPVFVDFVDSKQQSTTSTTVMESQLSSTGGGNSNKQSTLLINEFKANDIDSCVYNNQIQYRFNLTTIYWNANASHYLSIVYRDRYPMVFNKNLTTAEMVANIGELSSLLAPFVMNETSGKLYTTVPLDYELITRYDMTIIVEDNAWYRKFSILPYQVLVGDIDDFVNYRLLDTNSLQASLKPDPMSIGVLVVILFFVLLIIGISTSFLCYRNKKHQQHLHQQQRHEQLHNNHSIHSNHHHNHHSGYPSTQRKLYNHTHNHNLLNLHNHLNVFHQNGGNHGGQHQQSMQSQQVLPPSSSSTSQLPPPSSLPPPLPTVSSSSQQQQQQPPAPLPRLSYHHVHQSSIQSNGSNGSNGGGGGGMRVASSTGHHNHNHHQQQHLQHRPTPPLGATLPLQQHLSERSVIGHSPPAAGTAISSIQPPLLRQSIHKQQRNQHQQQSIAVTSSSNTSPSNVSITGGSESASVIASRIQQQQQQQQNQKQRQTQQQLPNGGGGGGSGGGGGGGGSIYAQTNSEQYTDNYSNMLAGAEHYDLENASSIAPSDIDIVYHYKGYRNRNDSHHHHLLNAHHLHHHMAPKSNISNSSSHAPLSRLSPSVSELSSVHPRILTLKDLSPAVPPCPPPQHPNQRLQHHHMPLPHPPSHQHRPKPITTLMLSSSNTTTTTTSNGDDQLNIDIENINHQQHFLHNHHNRNRSTIINHHIQDEDDNYDHVNGEDDDEEEEVVVNDNENDSDNDGDNDDDDDEDGDEDGDVDENDSDDDENEEDTEFDDNYDLCGGGGGGKKDVKITFERAW